MCLADFKLRSSATQPTLSLDESHQEYFQLLSTYSTPLRQEGHVIFPEEQTLSRFLISTVKDTEEPTGHQNVTS